LDPLIQSVDHLRWAEWRSYLWTSGCGSGWIHEKASVCS